MCFLLFFAINPAASAAIGMISGRNIRASLFLPILLAVLFLLRTWMFFDMGNEHFSGNAAGTADEAAAPEAGFYTRQGKVIIQNVLDAMSNIKDFDITERIFEI